MKNKLFLVLTLALGFLGCLSAAEQMTPKEHVEQRPIQGIKCDFCEKVFANKYSYSAHALDKHHDAYKAKKDDEVELKESSYVCLKCNMHFSCFTAKKIHRDAFHKGEEPFPCIFCTKAFWSKSSLSGHANREHSEDLSEINKFVCLQCGNSYENQNKLKFHCRYSATCINNADNDDMQEDAVVKRAKIDISQDVENTEINTVATTNHYREEIAKIEAAQILLSMKNKKK